MANNKVQLADGTTLIDLTSDTVTPQTMILGATAHDRSGEQITGVVELANAGTVIPLPDSGDGSVGNSTSYAREDHVHPENHAVFVVTGTTLASKTNTTFCTSSADSRITASTNIANVIFLESDIIESATFTATPNANGTVTLSGTTRGRTTTAIIECYN